MSVIEAPAPTTTSREVTAADVLHRAADLLEEFGWCQGVSGSKEEGRLCAVWAVYTARSDLGGPYPAAASGNEGLALIGFNDTPGRTKQEVVARLREMAEAA